MNMELKKQFAKQYSNTQIETTVSEATPHKLVEALYDGLLKNLILSKTFMEKKDFEKKAFYINKSLTILTALKGGLDLEKGSEIAENFWGIYDYAYRQLLSASAKNDPTIVNEIFDMMKGIASAWKEMPESIRRASQEQLKSLNV